MRKRNLAKALLFVVGLAIYLNIGWALGTYMYNNVKYSAELKGSVAVVLAGPNKMINHPTIPEIERPSLLYDQIILSVIWPLLISTITVSWIGYGILYGIYLLLWLIFAGGITKLFSVG